VFQLEWWMTLSSGQRRHFVPLSPWNKRTSAVGVDSNGYVNFERNLLKKSYNNSLHRMCGTDPVIFKKKKKKRRSWSCPKVMIIFFFFWYYFTFFPFRLIIYSFYPGPRHPFFFFRPFRQDIKQHEKPLRAHLLRRFWVRWEGQNSRRRRLDITRHSLHFIVKSSRVFLMWTHFYLTGLDRVRLWEGVGGWATPNIRLHNSPI
jgi:hypothetical protein